MTCWDERTLHTRQDGVALAFCRIKLHARRERNSRNLTLLIAVQTDLGLQIARCDIEIDICFDGIRIEHAVFFCKTAVRRADTVGNTGLVSAALTVRIGKVQRHPVRKRDKRCTFPCPCDITACDGNVQFCFCRIILQRYGLIVPCVGHDKFLLFGYWIYTVFVFQNVSGK